jgi:hypothetical protein
LEIYLRTQSIETSKLFHFEIVREPCAPAFFFQPFEKIQNGVLGDARPCPSAQPSRPRRAPVLANSFLGSNIHFLQAWAKNLLGVQRYSLVSLCQPFVAATSLLILA